MIAYMDDLASISEVGSQRVALSASPQRFRNWLTDTLAAVARGEDPATAPWSPTDTVRIAAEIEALAGIRRINSAKGNSK